MIEFEIIDDEPSKELTLMERSQVALGSAKHEVELRELVKASAGIVSVTNADGRVECHAAYMVLKNTRCNISSIAADSVEDAKKFTRAVSAEEKRLIEITAAEEDRLKLLRDGFDAKVKAEKDAAIAAERARVDSIKTDIQSIRDIAMSAVGMSIDEMDAALAFLDDFNCAEERFAEFGPDASRAVSETMDAITTLYRKAVAAKALAEKLQAEREAEAARVKAQAEENARMKAELDAQREAMEKAAQKAADAARAEARRHTEELAEQRRAAAELQAIEDDKRRAEHEAAMLAIREAQTELDRKQAEIDASELQRKRDDELAADIRKMDEADDAAFSREEKIAKVDLADVITDNVLETWPENVYFQAGDFDEVEDFNEYINCDDMPNALTAEPTNFTYVKYIRSDIFDQMLSEALSALSDD